MEWSGPAPAPPAIEAGMGFIGAPKACELRAAHHMLVI